jgi:hypothetical protein
MGPHHVNDQPRRRFGPQEEQDGIEQVIDVNDLQGRGFFWYGHDREGSQAPDQGGSAEGIPTHYHRRPQNHPVEGAAHEKLISRELAPGESGGRPFDPESREMNDPLDAGLRARAVERGWSSFVHCLRRFAWTFLQGAGAVDDGVNASKNRAPRRRLDCSGDIEPYMTQRYCACRGRAGDPDHRRPCRVKAARNGSANEAGDADYEDRSVDDRCGADDNIGSGIRHSQSLELFSVRRRSLLRSGRMTRSAEW